MSDPAPATASNGSSSQSLLLYKISTAVTYLLLLVTSFYYTFNKPHEGHHPHGRIWDHNYSTPFAQSAITTSIFWLLLFIHQLFYLYSLYSADSPTLTAATAVAPHFIAHNLLLFGFVHLWVRSHFWLSELLIVVNFFNLSYAYFQYSKAPRVIHVSTVSAPLAWNFVALYWVGAVAVHSNHLVARIVANVFIWGWVGYALFFLVAYKDYTVGFALSILAFSTGVGQFLTKPHVLQLQWIFAFSIGGLLFVLSLVVGVPGLLGRDPFPRGQIVSEDRERAPLLADD